MLLIYTYFILSWFFSLSFSLDKSKFFLLDDSNLAFMSYNYET